ncbi:DUF951 domain-containing protein [Staphylococcus xylosus]|uniref:DUF951 domain-containing protein n=1 Tax=Staphylococcus xylosus TaxID=1288 RepID=A0A939NCN1_STAXY|nr:DUF951 domain-containing protein [Staphylococcus xylosus]
MTSKYGLNDIVEMKNSMHVVRIVLKSFVGDIRIKCENCQRSIMIPRQTFNKN